jgi:hypothetical protein
VKSICQQASPGFSRLRSGQALRLRAINPPLCDGSARRFAQDDGFVEGLKTLLHRLLHFSLVGAPFNHGFQLAGLRAFFPLT